MGGERAFDKGILNGRSPPEGDIDRGIGRKSERREADLLAPDFCTAQPVAVVSIFGANFLPRVRNAIQCFSMSSRIGAIG
jgi:hypothetical protein